MSKDVTTLTDRGQVSMPAALRKELALMPGHKLLWQKVSDHECRVKVIKPHAKPKGARAMLGFARRFRPRLVRTTHQWMTELRAGEK